MRAGGTLAVWYALAFALLGFAFLGGFSSKVAQNGNEWISSPLNSHFSKYTGGRTLYPEKWTIIDRDGYEWQALSDEAYDDLLALNAADVASDKMDSVYHAIYGQQFGVVQQANKDLFGDEGGYSGRKGIIADDGKEYLVYTTISGELSHRLLQALKEEGSRGVVIVQNYKSGEILASVQTPAVSSSEFEGDEYVSRFEEDFAEKDGWLMDQSARVARTPGSIQKIASAIAINRNLSLLDLPVDRSKTVLVCDGTYETPSGNITCPYPHGPVSFNDAFAVSCNAFFAEQSIKLFAMENEGKLEGKAANGSRKYIEICEELGYNKSYPYFNRVNSYKSVISLVNIHVSERSAGWLAAGQGLAGAELETLPLHMLSLIGAIANRGQAVQPYTIKAEVAKDGEVVKEETPGVAMSSSYIKIAPDEAQDLDALMLQVCKGQGTAATLGQAMAAKGYAVAAKTGTAEVDQAAGKSTISWILAYAKEVPLAFLACVVEPETTSAATRIAAKIMPEAAEYLKK
jgi:cell division protein FtsI/penicillin-binding protein 2